MSAKFLILKNILAELKRKNSITVLEEHYQEKWEIYDLLMDLTNDENFKQAYIDLSFNKSFKKDFIELANQAKKAVSKYFRDKDIDLRAFYVKTNNSGRVLNINLINYNRSEPIRISDILQQERDISMLNIYCDKKHDIYAYRKGKERHYEFKEDAYYEITSTWLVQDKHGKTFTCTMVMNVSSSGITEVLQFNDKDFESPSKEFWNLIRENKELYIQGLSLHDAVKALLEKNKNAPAVINLQNNEHIVINKDEKMKDLENDAKSNPILSFTSNNISTQTEINPHQVATQTEANLQHTETQIEVAVQHVETQAEIGSQETETQTKVNLQEAAIQTEIAVQHIETQTEIASQQAEAQNLQEVATQTEVNLQHTETQIEVAVQHVETQAEIGSQETETQTEVNLQEAAVQTEVHSQQLDQKLTKAEQEIRELNEQRNELRYRFDKAEQELEESEKYNSDLQNELGKEKKKNAKLQTELTQKDKKLANISTELQERVQELESAHEGKKNLEIANAEKEELISELRKLQEELDQLKEEKYSLEDKLDQLELRINSTKESSKQQISDLEGKLLSLKEENQMLKAKQVESEQELVEVKQKIEELKKQCNDLQVECKEKEQRLEKETSKTDERIIQLNKEQEQKIQEIYEKNKELEEEAEELKKKLKTANAEQEKLQGKLNQFEKKEEEIEEVEHMISARDKCIASYKSQIQNLENEHNAHLESDEQEADQRTWDFETLKNELELKDEQIETIRGEVRQEIEEEIVNKYRPSLELKFKEYEDEIERLIREKKELNDKVQYLNNEVELLSPVIDKVLVNKKEVFDNNSKMFYQLTEKIDDSARSLSFDSAFHSDHCNSLLDLISSPSKVCSQSQREGV